MEIASPEVMDNAQQHDENHASSPLLREIQEAADLIRVEVYELIRVGASAVFLQLCSDTVDIICGQIPEQITSNVSSGNSAAVCRR